MGGESGSSSRLKEEEAVSKTELALGSSGSTTTSTTHYRPESSLAHRSEKTDKEKEKRDREREEKDIGMKYSYNCHYYTLSLI